MYLDHFKLSAPPFQFTTSPTELFMSSTHREGLAALEWGLLHEPSGLTLLAGDTGLGKTTLVCSLLSHRYQQVRTAYLGNPKLAYEELLLSVLSQLGIRGGRSNKGAMLTALVDFANTLSPNQRIAIIADEAQLLSDDTLEELRILSNVERKGRRAAQIILVGHLELLRRLANSELRHLNERINARAVLTPLNRKESYEYIEHRLRAGKASARQVFKSRALDYIVEHAAGVPRRINALCHNAMLLTYSANTKQVGVPMAKAAVEEYDNLHAAVARRASAPRSGRLQSSWSVMRSMLTLMLIGAIGFAAAQVALDRNIAQRLRSLGSSIANPTISHLIPGASASQSDISDETSMTISPGANDAFRISLVSMIDTNRLTGSE